MPDQPSPHPSGSLRCAGRGCSRRAWLGAAIALAAVPARPTLALNSLEPRLSLAYSLARSGLEIARIEEQFERSGYAYRLTSEARAVGLAAVLARGQSWRRESSGLVHGATLRPELFVDQRGTQPPQRARFDWTAGRVVFDRLAPAGEEAAGEAPLPDGALDRLSFPYALARLPLPESEWDIAITDGRRLTTYRYRVVARETLQMPGGTFDTVHVARVSGRDEPGADIWVSRSPSPVPVRIRVRETDGALFEQTLLGLNRA